MVDVVVVVVIIIGGVLCYISSIYDTITSFWTLTFSLLMLLLAKEQGGKDF